jgi:hypothetical protein
MIPAPALNPIPPLLGWGDLRWLRRTSIHCPNTIRERLILPASARRSGACPRERSDPAKSTMLTCEVIIVAVWGRKVFNSIVKIAWERDEDVFIIVSLDWRLAIPRFRIQNASYY